MNGINTLADAFKCTAYPVSDHGERDIQVLKDAFQNVDANLKSDIYGTGQVIEDFQQKMAKCLGMESAVFFPSGTMAQQIALRIWCDEKGMKRVAYHPLCHLEIHEQDGLKELHHIEPVLLADANRCIRLEDVLSMTDEVACLLLELPQREIGGQLPPYEELEAISAYCRERKIKLHLDGARLFETLPYYGKSAAEICQLFDSVYISFYKGFGGIAGAILAGSESFTVTSKIWKRRHGGDLISLYPYIISADYYFDQRVNKMGQYYEGAKQLAEHMKRCHGVTIRPEVPVSNMFHVHFEASKEQMEAVLISLYQETGVGLTAYVKEDSGTSCSYECSIGDRYASIPEERIHQLCQLLDERMKKLLDMD